MPCRSAYRLSSAGAVLCRRLSFRERIARLDIEQVRFVHGRERTAHEVLLDAAQGFGDLARDPRLPSIEELQARGLAFDGERLAEKIAGRRAGRAAQALDEVDQDRAIPGFIALHRGELPSRWALALVVVQERGQHF